MLVDTNLLIDEELSFRFTIVGGNPGHLKYICGQGKLALEHTVNYCTEEALEVVHGNKGLHADKIKWVKSIVLQNAGRKAEVEVKKRNLFQHYISVNKDQVAEMPSSNFTAILSTIIKDKADSEIITTLKKYLAQLLCGNI
jgi:hypothetical protein